MVLHHNTIAGKAGKLEDLQYKRQIEAQYWKCYCRSRRNKNQQACKTGMIPRENTNLLIVPRSPASIVVVKWFHHRLLSRREVFSVTLCMCCGEVYKLRPISKLAAMSTAWCAYSSSSVLVTRWASITILPRRQTRILLLVVVTECT